MAIEVKIFCKCGSKYKFDVEPLNRRLPGPVSCPVCRVDGTDEGNRILDQLLSPTSSGSAERVTTPMAPEGSSAPPRSAPPAVPRNAAEYAAARQGQVGPVAAPVPPLPAASSATPLQVSATHPVASVVPGPPPVPPASPTAAGSGAAKREYGSGESRLALGITGAVLSGIVGLIAWYFILLHVRKGFIAAIGVGALIGWVTMLLGRRGTRQLGLVAGMVAFVVIALGNLLATNKIKADREAAMETAINELYDADMAIAKKAAAAKTDEEMKAVVALDNSEDDDRADISAVSDEDLADFRKNRLPELRKLANGATSKSAYRKEHEEFLSMFMERRIRNEFGIATIFFLIAGVGAAFKVATKS